LQIPPMVLIRDGKPNETLVELLRANVRAPNEVMGDLWAEVASLRVIEQRTLSMMEEYDLSELAGLTDEIANRSEAAVRAAIAQLPPGTYRYKLRPDGASAPIEIQVALTFDGESCVVDYAGTSPELKGLSLNVAYSYSSAL